MQSSTIRLDVNIYFLAKSFFFRFPVPTREKRLSPQTGAPRFFNVESITLDCFWRVPDHSQGGARIGSKESKSPISLSFTATPLIDFICTAAIG
jgi:hypothetical protein